MASLVLPPIEDDPEGWGPATTAVPEHLRFLVCARVCCAAPCAAPRVLSCPHMPVRQRALQALARSAARAAGVLSSRLLVGRFLLIVRLIGCRAAAVCALLKERPRGSRLRVEHRARARPEAVLAARPVRQGGRAVAVRHGASGRGGIPPGRAEDTGQAQVGPRRSRRARRRARRNEVSVVLFASACSRGAVPWRRRVVACGRGAGRCLAAAQRADP